MSEEKNPASGNVSEYDSTEMIQDISIKRGIQSSPSMDSLSPTEIEILTTNISDDAMDLVYLSENSKGDTDTALSEIERDGDMWDHEIINTINTWYKEIHRIQWIYTEAFSDLVRTSNFYNRGNVLFSSVTAALAFVASQGSSTFNYIVIASSGLSILFQGLKNLSVPEDKMRKYTEYLGKVKSFSTIIKTEITIPIKYRRNGKKLILSLAQSYTELNSTRPVITTKAYKKYLTKYNDFIDTLSGGYLACDENNIV